MKFFRKKSEHPPMKATGHKVLLYTRPGCHLCEIAKETLMEQGLDPIELNIDADLQLFEKFKHCVPVVEIDGKIRFRGHVHPRLLKRILR